MGAAIKTEAFSAAQVSALRSGIAAIVLAIYLVLVKGTPLKITLSLLPTGVLYAASLTLFVAANKLTTGANAIFLQAVAPLYILILGPWALGERWTARDSAHVGALAARPGPVLRRPTGAERLGHQSSTGNLLAALSGVTWAGTLLFLRHLGRSGTDEAGGLGAVIVGNAMASLVAIPMAWPPPVAPAAAWAAVVYLGVFQIGLAYVFFTKAIRQVSALEASLLLLIEPVLNPMWTWLVHGESPGSFTLIGGAVIVTATAASARPRAERPA